jgi:hypothetical protein
MKMKKLLIAGGAVTGAALLARRRAASRGLDFGQIVERMPENAPPKWVFSNVSAIREDTKRIRENTERILQRLEGQQTAAGTDPAPDSA